MITSNIELPLSFNSGTKCSLLIHLPRKRKIDWVLPLLYQVWFNPAVDSPRQWMYGAAHSRHRCTGSSWAWSHHLEVGSPTHYHWTRGAALKQKGVDISSHGTFKKVWINETMIFASIPTESSLIYSFLTNCSHVIPYRLNQCWVSQMQRNSNTYHFTC